MGRAAATLKVTVALLCAGLSLGCEDSGEMAILDVEPRVGHNNGDMPVKIVGMNFRQDIGYTIYFGTKKADSVTILDPETILVMTPSKVEAGTVDIMIRADDGNAFKITDAFEFKDMGGSVIGGLGEAEKAKEEEKGNLAY